MTLIIKARTIQAPCHFTINSGPSSDIASTFEPRDLFKSPSTMFTLHLCKAKKYSKAQKKITKCTAASCIERARANHIFFPAFRNFGGGKKRKRNRPIVALRRKNAPLELKAVRFRKLASGHTVEAETTPTHWAPAPLQVGSAVAIACPAGKFN